jgi:hypothetical protein
VYHASIVVQGTYYALNSELHKGSRAEVQRGMFLIVAQTETRSITVLRIGLQAIADLLFGIVLFIERALHLC